MSRFILRSLGNALALNGSTQNVTFAVSSPLNCAGLTKLSVLIWVKPTSALASGSQYFVFVPGTNGGTAARVSLDFQGQKLRFGARDGDGGSFKSITTTEVVAGVNQWVHIGGTLDTVADIIKIYVNGRPVKVDTSQTWGTISTGNSGAVRIGSSAADNNYFPGQVDEFRFYADRILTDQDVLDIYNGVAITETSLSVYHKFESLNGTTLTDEQGNAGGAIVNSPSLVTGFNPTRTAV